MLAKRIITALVVIPLLLVAILFAPPSVVVVLATLAFLGGAWEWSKFLGWTRYQRRSIYVIATATVMLLTVWLIQQGLRRDAIYAIALIWWCVAAVWITRFPIKIAKSVIALGGFLTLVPPWVALVALIGSEPQGAYWLLFVLTLIWSADIGAYFVGRAFGRIKLAPMVSPGKTWEGVLGGLTFAALTGAVGAYWSTLPYVAFVPLCIAVAAISVIGDLTASMFKRASGLKDSGRLFPGHGGMLDRIDSITAAAPTFVLGAGWFSRTLGSDLGAVIDLASWEVPNVFRVLEEGGGVERDEMLRVFNMGVGMIVVVAPEDVDGVLESLSQSETPAWIMGDVEAGEGVRWA